jgi:hypothetical protein
MSGWKRAAAVLAVTGVAAVSAGGASAWIASENAAARQAIEADLAARGIDPATVVWQDGVRNYAGPNCPGRGWTCTESTRVVQSNQVAQNVAECGPGGVATSTASSDECVIVQTGATNHARCSLNGSAEPLAEQTCDITQTGERNTAHVDETIDQTAGPLQDARQRAFVSQIGTERSEVHVTQTVSQRTSVGTSQAQNAFQVVEVDQSATESDNASHVHQSQDQDESGSPSTQTQNTADLPAPEFDCGGEKPSAPNQCARIEQEVASDDGGKNDSLLHQSIDERQTTKAGTPSSPASQEQGTFDGGQEGDVEQTNPLDAGTNNNHANQALTQNQNARKGSAEQTQLTDPNCCGFSQTGGENNLEDINQSVGQTATEPDAFQFSQLFGQAHQEDEPPIVLGLLAATNHSKCSISQHASNNSDTEHSQATASPCPFLAIETTCESGGEGPGGCSSTTLTEPPSAVLLSAAPAVRRLPARLARLETY